MQPKEMPGQSEGRSGMSAGRRGCVAAADGADRHLVTQIRQFSTSSPGICYRSASAETTVQLPSVRDVAADSSPRATMEPDARRRRLRG
jgi:hypothetical protein